MRISKCEHCQLCGILWNFQTFNRAPTRIGGISGRVQALTIPDTKLTGAFPHTHTHTKIEFHQILKLSENIDFMSMYCNRSIIIACV